MDQEQHRIDYMDHVELWLHRANAELALDLAAKICESRGVEPPCIYTIDRQHMGPIEVWMGGGERDPVAVPVCREACIARLRCIGYERWLASNGPVKRVTSEFVRSMRHLVGTHTPDAMYERLSNPNAMVSGTAYGELLRGA